MSAMDMTSELVDQLVARQQWVNTRPDWIEVEKLRLLNGTLSNHLKLIQNDLFEAIGRYRVRDVAYDLQRFLNTFDPDVISALEDVVRCNEIIIQLTSDDAWITGLNVEF